ncbi:MAG: hypothetical protein LLG01_03925 [Planctomycetaceae bacterium]|nr:hypothetical protein [Planctomycetaceae bacterium]
MTEKTRPAGASPRGKWIFGLAAAIIALSIFLIQRFYEPMPPGNWAVHDDPQALFEQARTQNRRVLAFFAARPRGVDDSWMVSNTLMKNKDNIDQANVIRLYVPVKNLASSPVAAKYQITQLPTCVLFSPNGFEIRRGQGRIGQMPFDKELLQGETKKP